MHIKLREGSPAAAHQLAELVNQLRLVFGQVARQMLEGFARAVQVLWQALSGGELLCNRCIELGHACLEPCQHRVFRKEAVDATVFCFAICAQRVVYRVGENLRAQDGVQRQ